MIHVAVMDRIAKPGMKLGLTAQLTVSIVLLIVLVKVLTTFLDIHRFRTLFRNDLREQGLLLAKTLSDVLAEQVYFADVESLNDLVGRVGHGRSNLQHIWVFNEEGRVLAFSGREKKYDYLDEDSHLGDIGAIAVSGEPYSTYESGHLGIFYPLFVGPLEVEMVSLGYGEEKLNESIRLMIYQQIGQGIILVVLGMIRAYIIARQVTSPLQLLGAAAEDFGRGNLENPMPVTGPKAVSKLGQALETMRSDLRGLYQGLEEQVAVRTSQLSMTNEELLKTSMEHKQTEEKLAALFEVASAFGQPGSFEEKAKPVLDKVVRIAQADWVTVRLYQEDGLSLVAMEGSSAMAPAFSLAADHKQSVAAHMFREGRHLVVNDYASHPLALKNVVDRNVRSVVSLPLKSGGETIGVVNVSSREKDHFNEERVNLLETIVVGLSGILENARLYEHLILELAQRQHADAALREGEGNLQALINSAAAGIITIDQMGTIESFNAAAEVLFGYQADEIIGQPVSLLMPMPHRQQHPEFMGNYLATGESWILGKVREFTGEHKDGSEFNIELAVTEADLGDRKTFVGIIRDVSDRNRAKEELAQRARELEAANHELESFSYSVSHDLRAPLRSINGFSQALLEDYSQVLDAEGQDYLNRVRASSERMAELIDDLLELSRVTRSEMVHQVVDLSAEAKGIAADLLNSDPERRVEFEIADGLVANGDTRLLRVLLENLLRNSWKFTSGHPQAKISFGVTEHDGMRTFYVGDDGAGFDMAYAGKLFGAFQRLHSDTEFEGTGIGLATVQRIIYRHGGQVWAEGEVGKGARFFFTL